ncbi:hypothetical protein [Saccharopolyspora sp. 6V]|uniref:hypothetical protein n=1 Tax=Saccharopolyspora sp. 6V TaxID=2877239 RepID=UPI001CD70128|nr:hypothetical protein [Saccharopolyspora sp. 6V]MCA1196170.1 hypothetical protein [Saccharopolyspora sp. 6V]
MSAPRDAARERRRAGAGLAAVVLGTLSLVTVLVALIVARATTPVPTPAESGEPVAATPADPGDVSPSVLELVSRPMPMLPPQAVRPQPLSTGSAGPPIVLPPTHPVRGSGIPGVVPGTARGALAQLAALDQAALRGADPDLYSRGFTALSEPGAPAAAETGMHSLLRSLRMSAGMSPAGPVPGMLADFQPTHGQIKGTVGGRFVVVCVLGQLSVDHRGQTVTAGIGDCQAMRWNGHRWRIAATPLAAPAPSAWPGSDDAVSAGYRELREG